MKNRNRESKIIKDITKIENGIIYRYVLHAARSEQVASFNMPLYSIEIIMTKDGEVTRNTAKELFADVGKAISFFEKLADNLATPIDLPYIIEDKITF
ncbi:MAG: hypothetical protein IJD79_08630 [Clostridia bacterium]|nr:hypothetical protein [Clostridia bacterium]